MQKIKVQYLYHSGFRVESKNNIFIFDYYRGEVALGDKDTFIFSSHSHPDHYNSRIFKWQDQKPDSKYILSQDIKARQPRENIYMVSPYDEIKVDDISIKAYGSTDVGVSFLVKSPDISIFHAGDLNWWYWWRDVPEEVEKAEVMFKEEISKIKGESIDIAFFPVDPRLEHNYCVGADYFIQEVSPKILIPMHFRDDIQISKEYADKMKNSLTKVIYLKERGQEIILP